MKTKTTSSHPSAPVWLVVLAFAIVYVIWGSTYLGIRYAVESIPPFLMAATRHLAAGVVLFAFARARGRDHRLGRNGAMPPSPVR